MGLSPTSSRLALACLLLGIALPLHAQDTPPEPASSEEAADKADRPERDRSSTPAPAQEPKPYRKVITEHAQTQKGLFTVHSVKSKLYFEIPKQLLGKPLLMVANAATVPANVDHVGKSLNQEVVRFILRNNKVYFLAINHAYDTGEDHPNAAAVEASQRDAILQAFNVEAFGDDGAPVIEVTRLFTTEVGGFSARALLKATSLDAARSYVEAVRSFPGSLRIDAVQTYITPPMVNTPAGPKRAPPTFPPRPASLDIAYNLVELPAKPMMPRLMDDRVGYFYVNRLNFGDNRGSRDDRLITRWRLEKKNPGAALSEPVKPIVWYIDRSTPTALVPYVKKGVEAWNRAFEAAGFKNAVQARTFPSKAEDPEFDPEDVRYSIIRWVPSPITNAYGPHLSDPRTGEILNANIVMYHNILKMQRDWYIAQAGAVDPRAQRLPLPEDLVGDLVSFVVTHEVGHSLGFQHNMKASSMYSVDKLRDAEWLRTMGHVPSIMDYSRMNYLVQPEDEIDPDLLIPKIGPYDIFATRWGYAPIPGAKTPDEERPVLETWVREQDLKPWLRFSSPKGEGDYGNLMEAVGDSDALKATELGIRNLRRVVKLLPAITQHTTESDKDLEDLYKASWSQWHMELRHVSAIVGGYSYHNKHGGQPGATYVPASKAKQARAVEFLNAQLFATPKWLFEPAIVQRLRPGQPRNMLLSVQRTMLSSLLERSRVERLQAQEMALGDNAYGIDDLFSGLRAGVFAELQAGGRPDVPKRNLQRAYVELLAARLSGKSDADDLRAATRAELKTLQPLFANQGKASTDAVSRAHWDELAEMSARALDPLPTGIAARPRPSGLPSSGDPDTLGWEPAEPTAPASMH